MKKRERRRYLTERYQRRQIRLSLHGKTVFDFERRPRTDHAKRQAFVSMLKGDYTRAEWQWGIDLREVTDQEKGRYRRHSFADCGRPRCPTCSNPRHNGFGSLKHRLTWQEVVAEQRFREDFYEYWEKQNDQDDEQG